MVLNGNTLPVLVGFVAFASGSLGVILNSCTAKYASAPLPCAICEPVVCTVASVPSASPTPAWVDPEPVGDCGIPMHTFRSCDCARALDKFMRGFDEEARLAYSALHDGGCQREHHASDGGHGSGR